MEFIDMRSTLDFHLYKKENQQNPEQRFETQKAEKNIRYLK